jgi:hypothetical protein
MTDPCAWSKCRHTFDEHAGGFHCYGADSRCECRRYVSTAAIKASIARHPSGKGLAS